MSSATILVRSWIVLIALSLATTALTLVEARGQLGLAIAAAVLMLAGFKVRIILARYLGLSGSRFWMGAFSGTIGGFLVTAFLIHLMGRGA